MKEKKIELLAPAGSFEALKAAVLNGADAVYLGGGKFNARVNAGNFSDEELILALDYAHDRGVKIYLTLNTLLKNEELEEALGFTAFAYQHGVDAVIVQDLGFLNVLRTHLPGLEVHASTQMTLTNSQSVEALEKLGVQRVVLSRELTLDEIQSIASKCQAELEVFVHGALCVSYSGQCLMSSFVGGRSGNRGICAQPCRLPWSISHDGKAFGKDAYLISPRDLMAIEFLPELKRAGVSSLKLEGRMKSAEYVAIVTSIYRKYLNLLQSNDGNAYAVAEADRERLLQAFNRGGFTQNYLKGDRDFTKLVYTKHPKNQGILIGTAKGSKPLYAKIELEKPLHMGDGIEIMDEDAGPYSIIVTAIQQNGAHVRFADAGTSPWVGDVKTDIRPGSPVYKTLSKPLFEEARETYERASGEQIPLDMQFTLNVGKNAILKVSDDAGNIVTAVSENLAEKAINKALSKDRISEQLHKTGDTPYRLRHLEVISDGESTIAISVINAMRREALENIRQLRIGRYKKADVSINYNRAASERNGKTDPALAAFFYEAPESLEGLDGMLKRVYLPIIPQAALIALREQFAGQIYIWTPAVLKDTELNDTIEALRDIRLKTDGFCTGNLGALGLIRETFPEKALCADFPMNLFNDEALLLQKRLGIKTCVISPELRLNEVRELQSLGLELEALAYGRVPLMTMEHCPSAAETKCSGICGTCARKKGLLKDRKGEIFPFVRDPVMKRTQIFNTVPVLMDDTSALKETPLDFLRLSFTGENIQTIVAVIKHFSNKIKGFAGDAENSSRIESIKNQGFTKGHWFRGV